ncbi:fimbrillin family protein [Bacteroides cellulosilyticus]|uniref:fimbrillin family protein n=1 Tax=Bacteroides cellulosilyticus TaxID=246787 RepID=UPI00356982CD
MTTVTYKKLLLLAALPAMMLASCTREDFAGEPGNGPDTPDGQIRFQIGFAPQDGADYAAGNDNSSGAPATRVATDTRFKSTWEDGDAIGIFAAPHGTQLAAAGNPIHNVRLTYSKADNAWSGPAYWPPASSGISTLSFYAYYPYDDNGGSPATLDPTAIAFNVHTDQSGTTTVDGTPKSNYSLSDLLMARPALAPDMTFETWARGAVVSLTFRHALAMVQVSVAGSMLGDYDPALLRVRLNGCAAATVLDLAAGQTKAPAAGGATAAPITMYPCPNDGGAPGTFAYRALVPAQTVAAGTALFRFEHGGSTLLTSRQLTDALALKAGETEMFGISFPFTSVTVSATERLAGVLTEDKLATVTRLKVSGEMTAADFQTILGEMPALTNLDLGGAMVVGNEIPVHALYEKSGLKEFVFPRNIVAIGKGALYNCSGLSGKLTIPAGVTTIGESAFSNCSGFNELTIPADVTAIGNFAFRSCTSLSSITCHIPDPGGVTYGSDVFMMVASTTPLYVPAASVNAYKSHDEWKDFINIHPIPQP